jgi:hypothetical protein
VPMPLLTRQTGEGLEYAGAAFEASGGVKGGILAGERAAENGSTSVPDRASEGDLLAGFRDEVLGPLSRR